jgi:uncharacterized damage-inducible protein DinB
MNRSPFVLALLLVGTTSTIHAQTVDPTVSALKNFYDYNKRNIVASAEKMPAEHFGFRPVSEIRSFAEVLGHVSNMNYLTCSLIKAEANPNKENLEKTATSKDTAMNAIKASFDYCDGAFKDLSEATMKETYKSGNRDVAKASAVVLNVVHDMEHYGNIVTYLRLKGIVPSSSERAPRQDANRPKN